MNLCKQCLPATRWQTCTKTGRTGAAGASVSTVPGGSGATVPLCRDRCTPCWDPCMCEFAIVVATCCMLRAVRDTIEMCGFANFVSSHFVLLCVDHRACQPRTEGDDVVCPVHARCRRGYAVRACATIIRGLCHICQSHSCCGQSKGPPQSFSAYCAPC